MSRWRTLVGAGSIKDVNFPALTGLILLQVYVVVAVLLLGTSSEITSLSFAGNTISSYLSVGVLGLLVVAALPTFARRAEAKPVLWSLWPWAVFAAYVVVSALLTWTREAAQVAVLSLVVLLGIWVVANGLPARAANKLLLLAPIIVASSYLLSLFLPYGIDPRAFAMTGLLGLAVTLPRIAKNPVWILVVAIIFVAVVLSASRAATLVAIITVGLYFLLQGGRYAVLRALGAWLTSSLATVAAYASWGPAQSRLQAGDGAIQVSVSAFGFRGGGLRFSSEGRFFAWGRLLGEVDSSSWLFGNGAGYAAQFGKSELPPGFPQALNEYVRILVDFGVVGLTIFMVGAAMILWRLFQNRLQPHSMVALLGLGMALVIAITEGPFVFPFFAIPLSVFIGMGLAARIPPDSNRPTVS